MRDADFAMWFQVGAAAMTAVVLIGCVWTWVGIWRDEKKWKEGGNEPER